MARTLSEWFDWQRQLHPRKIDLGLSRVAAVAGRLGLTRPAGRVITVGGTNGKGSCVALAEAILRSSGYRVGAYTSPHLVRYNERIRIAGREVSDEALIGAFRAVDQARDGTSLSEFEFGTLSALLLFEDARLDVAILEVGLGGRLDAVNVVDPDVAVIASVDLDHQEWLGDDRESIGREKAGIMRRGIRVVCGDAAPPQSLLSIAAGMRCDLRVSGRDFGVRRDAETWNLIGLDAERRGLPYPALRGSRQTDNAAAVLMALDALVDEFPLEPGAIHAGLRAVRLPGRFDHLGTEGNVVADIAHNPAAAAGLAADLDARPVPGADLAVFTVLADKDVAGIVDAVGGRFGKWFVATLGSDRGLAAEAIREILLARVTGVKVTCYRDIVGAYTDAMARAGDEDRVVVFGSAFGVGELMAALAD
ncbi:MAG: bifunctional tetrahydrofolate synthase/dihydrofolate synthase [Gammaproteobacteria bacterium]|jgi:dihydrofolate synthase/folylpolyglutamate synthase|nr:bifunctional tetrahydrofolate synthase/dihydrofolate synthase [Gammaproteobacteria bacterium]